MAKILMLKVEDNTALLDELEKYKAECEEQISDMEESIDSVAKENLIKIAAYVKEINDQYSRTDVSKRMCLQGRSISGSCNLSVRNDVINGKPFSVMYVNFNYSGTPNKRNEPDFLKVIIEEDSIKITDDFSYQGVADLCGYWSQIKDSLNERLRKAIQSDDNKKKDELQRMTICANSIMSFEL